MNTYAIEAIHSDQGTIVLFEGTTLDGNGAARLIAVDHRMAQGIADALAEGEEVIVDVEPWQIVGTVR